MMRADQSAAGGSGAAPPDTHVLDSIAAATAWAVLAVVAVAAVAVGVVLARRAWEAGYFAPRTAVADGDWKVAALKYARAAMLFSAQFGFCWLLGVTIGPQTGLVWLFDLVRDVECVLAGICLCLSGACKIVDMCAPQRRS